MLHDVEDRKTLIRTIIDVAVVRADNGVVQAAWTLGIRIAPGGTTVFTPSVASALDQNRIDAILWETGGVSNRETASGDNNIDRIYRDIKGMRKVSPGDEIEMFHDGDVANSFHVVGVVTQFFKE